MNGAVGSSGASARLNEGVEEDGTRVSSDLLEFGLHALDGLGVDLSGRAESLAARKQQVRPELQELRALGGSTVVEVDRSHVGFDL